MPSFILKFGEDQYVRWSTVVDAPTTYICTRDEMKKYLIRQAKRQAILDAEESLQSADDPKSVRVSYHRQSLEQIISGNRAGKDEKELSLEEIKKQYTYTKKRKKSSNENVKTN